MLKSPFKTLLAAFIAVLVFLVLSAYVFGKNGPGTSLIGRLSSDIYNSSSRVRLLVNGIKGWKSLESENESLKEQNRQLVSDSAKINTLEEENNFLKASLGLSSKLNTELIPAGIFSLDLAPDGYHALINKGSNDSVSNGETVITEDGILVGQITEVFKDSSRITIVSDPNLKITAQILNSKTAGIAKGALRDGIKLDLIVQADQIKEGDIVISSGNDRFPAGLVIGTVRLVAANETQLFKDVYIKPAIEDINLDKVLIIKN